MMFPRDSLSSMVSLLSLHHTARSSSLGGFLVKGFLVREFLVKELLVREFLVKEFLVRVFLVKEFRVKEFLVKEYLVSRGQRDAIPLPLRARPGLVKAPSPIRSP